MMRAAEIVRRRVDAIAQVLTREEGKTLREAKGEVIGGALNLEFLGAGGRWADAGDFAEPSHPTTLAYTRRNPRGVIAVITPWNFPCANPALKIASALVAGNSVIWKPAPWTPATALALTQCFIDAGLPAGVLSTLIGGDDVGASILNDSRIAAITFTGSSKVGRLLAAQSGQRMVPIQLEMGGKNAAVVLADAHIDSAAASVARGAFLSTGQKCTSLSRVIVLPSIKASFLEALVERAKAYKVGDPTNDAIDIGPVVHERQLKAHLAGIDEARAAGAQVILGGSRLGAPLHNGHFLPPTILDGVESHMSVAQQELFGPVLAVIDALDEDAAIEICNDTGYGLAAAVYTQNLESAFRFAEAVEAGIVKVNAETPGYDPQLPTGGLKASGFGPKELGRRPFDFFTEEKSVYVNYQPV